MENTLTTEKSLQENTFNVKAENEPLNKIRNERELIIALLLKNNPLCCTGTVVGL